MTRSRLGLLGLCAVILGVTAISAGSAQAALSWLVLNAAGTTATELKAALVAEKDSQHISLLTKQLNYRAAITCTNLELVGFNLEAGGKLTEGGKIKFTGCEAFAKGILEEPMGCHIKSSGAAAGTIVTNELKGELVLHTLAAGGTEVLTKIEPKTAGGPILNFLTEECILPETNPVRGVLFLKDCEKLITTHAVKHLFEQGPLTSLYVGSHTVEHLETSIDGSIWLKLGGAHTGLKWSAMDA
jgi:hypothetical protein